MRAYLLFALGRVYEHGVGDADLCVEVDVDVVAGCSLERLGEVPVYADADVDGVVFGPVLPAERISHGVASL